MNIRKNIILFFSLILFLLFFLDYSHFSKKDNGTEIIFLNVGTGSGTLIKTKDNKKILVDAGNDKVFFKSLTKEISFFDRKIDFLIASHADLDHIGNFIDILKNYKVENYFFNGAERTEKKAFVEISRLLKEKKIKKNILKEGDMIKISKDLKIKVFSPPEGIDAIKLKSNSASIVFQLIYKNRIKIMFTGDLPSHLEKFLVMKYGKELKSDVLLAGHHGSKTSSSFEFINTVLPEYSIISTSKNNSYGHPNAEVIERLQQINSKILYTFSDNGKNIVFKLSDNELFYVGRR